MEIFKDDKTGLEYVDFEDVLDEGIEIDNTTKLLINSIILDYIDNVATKLIELDGIIRFLKPDIFTHDEIVVYRHRLYNLHFDLDSDYSDSHENDGIWKYIDNYTIEDLYKASVDKPILQLSEIFEDKNFLKNMYSIKAKGE